MHSGFITPVQPVSTKDSSQHCHQEQQAGVHHSVPQVRSFYLHRADECPVREKHKHEHRQPQFSCVVKAKGCKYNRLSYHILDLKRQNRFKVGTDQPKLKVKMQSVSDEDFLKSPV